MAGAHGCGTSAGHPLGAPAAEEGRGWLVPGWPGPGGGPRWQGGWRGVCEPGASSGRRPAPGPTETPGTSHRCGFPESGRGFAHSPVFVLTGAPAGRAVTTPFLQPGNRLRRLNRFPGVTELVRVCGKVAEPQQAGLASGWGLSRAPVVPSLGLGRLLHGVEPGSVCLLSGFSFSLALKGAPTPWAALAALRSHLLEGGWGAQACCCLSA